MKCDKTIVSNDEVKFICSDILNHFSSFCKEHNLRFSIAYGTAIGAVRHHGFIPWDDDVDVIMPRTDYNLFIESYGDNQKYKLFEHSIIKDYYYPYAKLCDRDTVVEEKYYSCNEPMGVYIDIFPIDGCGNTKEQAVDHLNEALIMQYKLRHAMATHFLKDDRNIAIEILRYVRYKLLKLVGPEYFYNKLMRKTMKHSFNSSKYVSNIVWDSYGSKEIMLASSFDDYLSVLFEYNEYPIIHNYDDYLTSLYGDYMTPPPKESQITHHEMNVYRNSFE